MKDRKQKGNPTKLFHLGGASGRVTQERSNESQEFNLETIKVGTKTKDLRL